MARKFSTEDIVSQNLIKSSVQRSIKLALTSFLCSGVPSTRCCRKGGKLFWQNDPEMMPKMQVDKGALKFILRGSNVMCPGLTSEGGAMDDVNRGEVVVGLTWRASPTPNSR
ncbi:cell cycle regulator, putative [Babesia ovata]|uniref:Cell cycle regulator, putative n=1 Tax=Babesia ovata TaxID=189622 RepID=A0A2H6KCD6_9APIC|nr:cell cycle regulator, putative [Babesia ovata]GBE60619.1 cell cycle regulator, putative [Babesia ovata]